MTDKVTHDARGEGHHLAKLSNEQAQLVKRLLKQREVARRLMEGLTLEAIGRRVGVGKNAVYHISKKNSWAHIKEEG